MQKRKQQQIGLLKFYWRQESGRYMILFPTGRHHPHHAAWHGGCWCHRGWNRRRPSLHIVPEDIGNTPQHRVDGPAITRSFRTTATAGGSAIHANNQQEREHFQHVGHTECLLVNFTCYNRFIVQRKGVFCFWVLCKSGTHRCISWKELRCWKSRYGGFLGVSLAFLLRN